MFVDKTFWLAGRRCVVALLTGCHENCAGVWRAFMCERVESTCHLQQPQRADTRHLRYKRHRASPESLAPGRLVSEPCFEVDLANARIIAGNQCFVVERSTKIFGAVIRNYGVRIVHII